MLYYRIILYASSIPEAQKTQISRVDFLDKVCIGTDFNCEDAATPAKTALIRKTALAKDQNREKVLFYMRICKKPPA